MVRGFPLDSARAPAGGDRTRIPGCRPALDSPATAHGRASRPAAAGNPAYRLDPEGTGHGGENLTVRRVRHGETTAPLFERRFGNP